MEESANQGFAKRHKLGDLFFFPPLSEGQAWFWFELGTRERRGRGRGRGFLYIKQRDRESPGLQEQCIILSRHFHLNSRPVALLAC